MLINIKLYIFINFAIIYVSFIGADQVLDPVQLHQLHNYIL